MRAVDIDVDAMGCKLSVRCDAVRCAAVLCDAVLCCAVLCDAVLCDAVRCLITVVLLGPHDVGGMFNDVLLSEDFY